MQPPSTSNYSRVQKRNPTFNMKYILHSVKVTMDKVIRPVCTTRAQAGGKKRSWHFLTLHTDAKIVVYEFSIVYARPIKLDGSNPAAMLKNNYSL